MALTLTLLLLAINPPSRDELAGFIAGVEKTPEVVNGKPLARVGREAGEVISVNLDGMTLAPDDFRLVGRIVTLRTVIFRHTNVTDQALAHLRGLPKLQYVVLTDTEVTDQAIDVLTSLPALRTCCMGNVKITPAGIEKLKERFPKLSLGYSQRK
jgi:hypothetical protein